MRSTKQNLRLLALVIAIPAVVTVLIWPLPQPPEPGVKSTFLGFTNEILGPMALFSVPNFPSGPTPDLREIAYQENGIWKPWSIPTGMFVRYSLDTNKAAYVIMTLPVATTNQPMRAVFVFPGQESSLRETIQRTFNRIVFRSAPRPAASRPARERSLFFTNETKVSKAIDSP